MQYSEDIPQNVSTSHQLSHRNGTMLVAGNFYETKFPPHSVKTKDESLALKVYEEDQKSQTSMECYQYPARMGRNSFRRRLYRVSTQNDVTENPFLSQKHTQLYPFPPKDD